jgi:hypothetical protein
MTTVPVLGDDHTIIEHIVQMQMSDAVMDIMQSMDNTINKGIAAMKEVGVSITPDFYENAAYFFEECFDQALRQYFKSDDAGG